MIRPFDFKKCIELIKENWWEYIHDDVTKDLGFPQYYRPIFAIRMLFVWLINWKCGCGDGMTGYEYREACDNCDGFSLNVHFNLRQMWINFWKDKYYEERCWYEFRKEEQELEFKGNTLCKL